MKPMVSSVALVAGALLVLSAISAVQAQTVRYGAVANASKVRIDGTSSVHDWAVEGTIIGGFMELPADFPLDASKPLPAALSVKPKVEISIPISSLNNLRKSQPMDKFMNEKLLADSHPRITYQLTEIKPGKTDAGKLNFDTKGNLVVAGVTNNISMPVAFEKQPDNKLKVTGGVTVKMTDFKIEPPSPTGSFGLIKTGDEVKLSFEWVTVQKPAPQSK